MIGRAGCLRWIGAGRNIKRPMDVAELVNTVTAMRAAGPGTTA